VILLGILAQLLEEHELHRPAEEENDVFRVTRAVSDSMVQVPTSAWCRTNQGGKALRFWVEVQWIQKSTGRVSSLQQVDEKASGANGPFTVTGVGSNLMAISR
jgi:hypothetical protein